MYLLGVATGLAVAMLPSGSLAKVAEFFGEVMTEMAKQKQQAQQIHCDVCGYDGTSTEEHQAQHQAYVKDASPGPVPIRDNLSS